MGMFDYVRLPEAVPCWKCGEPLTDWQTKDTDCLLSTVTLNDVDCFYTSCKECRAWTQFERKRPAASTMADFAHNERAEEREAHHEGETGP